ncbi:MAG: ribosome silencing factor [Hyphomicrobiales bacterium]|nr:ribosome silencing factor [Hyphomicrobiales bacterium]MCY4038938.1 ribosome silencing factor [Hyphomicrobiales bacterium]
MPLVKTAHTKEPSAGVLLDAVRETLDEYQANDIVCLDVTARTALADFMVIASGRSRMHVGALRDHLLRRLKELGAGRVQVEGGARCDWVLIDGGGVWINLFHPEIREFYNLEKLWSPEAPAD